jgi:uncharacterized NAD(P)/FAD-binding protein YdhS
MPSLPVLEEPAALRVAVVGGGAAGVIAAVHLLRAAHPQHPVHVHLVEQAREPGPGLAYRTAHRQHTVNNYAARLSAIDGDPDHLLRWCATRQLPVGPTGFVPRRWYGDYLRDVLANVGIPAGSALSITRGTVRDLTREGPTLRLHLSAGWSITADTVVLALGNPPPKRQPRFEGKARAYVADPWASRTGLAGELAAEGDGPADVLLLGTGLTMVDAVAELHEALPLARFTAVSRSGHLPSAHRPVSQRLHDAYHPGVAPLPIVLERVQARIGDVAEVGGDWRDVIDSVRASANDLWRGFSPEEQELFVTSLARRWEQARHRMSPAVAELVASLRRSGRLHVARMGDVDLDSFSTVVNCTGPAPVPTRRWNPLVDALLDRGTIRPHRLGLGLDLDEHGRVIGSDGRADPAIYAVGAARKGVEWEVSAIPDLRGQASRLAADLVEPLAVAPGDTSVTA